MNARTADLPSDAFSIPPAEVFLSLKAAPENADLENRKLAALVRILSTHSVIGPYMKMRVSDTQFSSRLRDAVAQSQMQATMFARFDAAATRAEMEAEQRAGSKVSFLGDRGVRAVGEAQLESLFRRKKTELTLLKSVPVSAMTAENH